MRRHAETLCSTKFALWGKEQPGSEEPPQLHEPQAQEFAIAWDTAASRPALHPTLPHSITEDPTQVCRIGNKCPILHANQDQVYPIAFNDDCRGTCHLLGFSPLLSIMQAVLDSLYAFFLKFFPKLMLGRRCAWTQAERDAGNKGHSCVGRPDPGAEATCGDSAAESSACGTSVTGDS
jgi:hypothetical protein